MTTQEARRAFREMVVSLEPEHAREVEEMISKAEQEEDQGGAST